MERPLYPAETEDRPSSHVPAMSPAPRAEGVSDVHPVTSYTPCAVRHASGNAPILPRTKRPFCARSGENRQPLQGAGESASLPPSTRPEHYSLTDHYANSMGQSAHILYALFHTKKDGIYQALQGEASGDRIARRQGNGQEAQGRTEATSRSGEARQETNEAEVIFRLRPPPRLTRMGMGMRAPALPRH